MPGPTGRGDEGEWARRARSFGQVAELYDRVRPGYPDALYADVLAMAPGRRVLEAGAGTGRVTLALAVRGAAVTAIEPDPAMAAVVRRRTARLDVQVAETTFEDCAVQAGAFDLVVAAQSWHWVDRERGAGVAHRALGPGGALCLWWNRPRGQTGPVWDAVRRAYAEHAPSLVRDQATTARDPREVAVEPAPGFPPWTVRTYDWSTTYGAADYAALVSTHSDHLVLPGAQRERLLAAVGAAIDAVGGGALDHPYRTVLLSAQRG